ncbi:hypothetical protein GCM10011352_33020 [Marinobacterium zhoushanense]|uniref:Uncharacterized protein n=1 Tax=Marinobacterium zhoushanense TaxID=1679163 RepID=A0ABQ1KNR9_9GAMM|nr:hypothetical protein [Marinobacterium zhoushanense]GGC04190.1 hypothetical protein GCM10011352_33020 [Marinobacterium zhoushanense]
MLEFIPVFIFTLILLVLLVVFMSFGRLPAYRPSRVQVRELLAGVLDRSTSVESWELFLGLPIHHDAELEAVRRRCVAIHEGLEGERAAGTGLDGYLYDRDGRERIGKVLAELDELIRHEPITREF